MNINRIVSFAAALVINATVGAAFSALPVHARAAQAVSVPLAGAASEEPAVQEIVVTARRPS